MKDMTSTVTVAPVPPDHLVLVWNEVAPMLELAVRTAKGRYALEDVKNGIINGTYLLWVVFIEDEIVAAITTRIIEYPRCKAMALDWIGGRRMKEWIGPANAAMVTHAKHNGCVHMEGYGRAAWIRWNGRYGWKEDYTAYRMELNDADALPPV